MIITNTPVEYYEVKEVNDGNIAFITKHKIDGEWKIDTKIKTRREALGTRQAISDIVLGGLK